MRGPADCSAFLPMVTFVLIKQLGENEMIRGDRHD